ncbi:MAG: multidrug effflux MFS transporter [Alcaligenes sp.]
MNYRNLTLVLAALAMLGPFATDAYLPAFHRIGAEFEVDPSLVQQTLSVYLFGFAFMSLFWGTLSDSFGRRPVILASLILFGIGSIGSALAPSFGWLLFFRMLQGCSAGAGRVVGQALARDCVQGAAAQRLFAHITMVFSLAPAIAPVVGGYLSSHTGWRAIFWMLTLVTAGLIALCLRQLPETLPPASRQPMKLLPVLGNYYRAVRNGRFLLAILAVAFAFGGFALYIASAAGFVIGILGLPETAFAWLFLPFIGGMLGGSMINARFAERIAPARMIRLGLSILFLGAGLNTVYNLFFQAAVPWAVLPIFIYAFGMSMALPGMTVVTLGTFPTMRGLASSLQSAVQMLIFATVSGVIAPLLFDSALLLALGMLASAALSASLWWCSQRGAAAQSA